jgi:VIT1/CCC1 family predicted Fe2+/Mn2+ transporter
MVNEKPSTHNAQPNFTPYALRFTLSTLNSQLISGLTPLLPAIFTLYALRFKLIFSKIANFAIKSVKSRITNHAPDGYQMTTEVVII